MKKITLLLVLLPFINFAQGPWNFNNTDDAWTTVAATPSNGTNAITLTTNGATNPVFGTLTAGVDATVNKYAVIKLKVGAGGPPYLRVSFPNTTGGRVYKPVVITNADTDFKTYYVDLTNANWTGIVNDIKLHFKDNNATAGGADHISTGVTIEIDKVEIVQYPEKYIYEFNTVGNLENWSTIDCAAFVDGGNLFVTPTVGLSSKINQDIFAANASANGYLHITYRNTSALNNQIRFQFKAAADGFTAFRGKNATVNQNMAGFETISIDMTTVAEWTGMAKNFQIGFRDTNNTNLASAGDFIIDRIVINNSPTLSTTGFSINEAVTIYPNPATTSLNFDSNETVTKVTIFNITGQNMITNSSLNNGTLDVSELARGIYFARVSLANGNSGTIKFIKE
jgi:hypothetical protein